MLIEFLFEKFPNWEAGSTPAIGDLEVSLLPLIHRTVFFLLLSPFAFCKHAKCILKASIGLGFLIRVEFFPLYTHALSLQLFPDLLLSIDTLRLQLLAMTSKL